MSSIQAVIFIMVGIAVFLMIGFIRQFRTATKIRKEVAEASGERKAKEPAGYGRLAEFDRILFDVLGKRKRMSKEDYDFLMESIPLLYTGEAEIEAITEQVNALYRSDG